MNPAAQSALLDWYRENARPLPWRSTRDPYAIWVSEVMSQQTRVDVAAGYWHRWLAAFPTIESLAKADPRQVLALWQGLGYYRRATMLLEGAKWVHQNGLPTSSDEWRQVPGVGPYTAGAIASICLGEAVPAVDGNVQRVYSRFVADAELKGLDRRATAWASDLVPADNPGEWNQAMMELGARVCTPRSPQCGVCPVAPDCEARKRGIAHELPPVKQKAAPTELFQVIYVAVRGRKYLVRPIPKGGWWQGMHSFPYELVDAPLDVEPWQSGIYVVTNHRIRYQAFLAEPDDLTGDWLTAEEVRDLGMPAVHQRLLERLTNRVWKVAEQPALEIGDL